MGIPPAKCGRVHEQILGQFAFLPLVCGSEESGLKKNLH